MSSLQTTLLLELMAFTGSLFHISSVPSRQCLPESSFSRPPSFSRTAFLQQTCFHSPSAH
eukprot:6109239-Pleurochrysis_carterae.AAC.1